MGDLYRSVDTVYKYSITTPPGDLHNLSGTLYVAQSIAAITAITSVNEEVATAGHLSRAVSAPAS